MAMEFRQEPVLRITNKSELVELEVIENFIWNFERTYGTHHAAFVQKPFRQAISENIFTLAEEWRVIALYLHHDDDHFAQKWCRELVSEETIAILEEHFCVLPWDISDNSFHEVLKNTLASNLNHSFNNFFRYKKSGVLFILQQNGVPSVFSTLQGDVSSETILHTLREIGKILITESAEFQKECEMYEEIQPKNGSERFQQYMFENLGDRDYDCFEYSQMDELKSKIGFALFGSPQENDGYDEKGLDQINSIFNSIMEENMYAKYRDQIIIAFIFNCSEPLPEEKLKRQKKNPDYNPDSDIGPVPIFVLKKCYNPQTDNGCRIFIDHECRVYTSWSQYIKNNRLDECVMVLPQNGRYLGDEDGTVKLDKYYSPACKFGAKAAKIAEISAGGVGLVSGGVMVAAAIPAITVAPLVITGAVAAGAVAGAVSIVRSSMTLFDMKKHKQDTNIIRSKEARGAAINIAAGTVGFAGTAATAALSNVVSRGANVGKVAQGAVNALNATNVVIGGAALGNSIYHVYCSWESGEKISSLTALQLAASFLFFANSVYSFKTASTIIEENQTNVINQMKSDLQSNNRRKMFDKMHKETIRMNGGNKQAGTAEVISTIRRIPNKDEIFAILKANNKLFNKNGVKFSASGSEILLNGQALDLGSFATLSKTQRLQVLSEMPATPAPQQDNVITTSSLSGDIIKSLANMDPLKLVSFGYRLFSDSTSFTHALQIALQEFSATIQNKLFTIAVAVLGTVDESVINIINDYLPHLSEPIIPVLNLLKEFAWDRAIKYRREYEESKRRAKRSCSDFDEDEFNKMYGIHPGVIDKSLYFFEVVTDVMVYRGRVVQKYLAQICAYVTEFIIANFVNNKLKQRRRREQEQHYRAGRERIKKPCLDCGGYYFVEAR